MSPAKSPAGGKQAGQASPPRGGKGPESMPGSPAREQAAGVSDSKAASPAKGQSPSKGGIPILNGIPIIGGIIRSVRFPPHLPILHSQLL